MKGKIIAISGPTVTVRAEGLRLYDRVALGAARLMGEVVRLERECGVVQVYEETRGLAVGEPVTSLGQPLAVRLGPALLGRIFDGLQRPLPLLAEKGPFVAPGSVAEAFPLNVPLRFVPVKRQGEPLAAGEPVGFVEEGELKHWLAVPGASGVIAHLAEGELKLAEPLGRLRDGRELFAWHDWPVRVPRPYRRKLAPATPLVTGQRIIDFLFPLARGGTAIFPGGFGTGKTILEQTVAKYADADIVIYVGCGERGNEMAEMLEEFGALTDPWSGRPLSERTVMVVNTSNMPVAAREASIYTAVTMAEYYRDMGYDVLLLADSISRWAEALREISSALEEMPGEEGYPTYIASRLASYFARAGAVETLAGTTGSLSMILSVSPPGGDFTEPVTQACLRGTGAFLMLDTALAQRRHFPAINWTQSFSLYAEAMGRHFGESVDAGWVEAIRRCHDLLAREAKIREVAEIVGAEGLQESDLLLLHTAERIREEFLCQNAYTDDAFATPAATYERIAAILEFHRDALARLEAGEELDIILGRSPDASG